MEDIRTSTLLLIALGIVVIALLATIYKNKKNRKQ